MKHLSKTLILLIVLFLILVASTALSSRNLIAVKTSTSIQYNWHDAVALCESKKLRLPHIWELSGLYYWHQSEPPFVQQTDYWSQNHLFNYALGLNTRWGILSFDKTSDEDHVLCVTRAKG